jgi:predicted HicB family RNase H-like nuclease
MNEDNSTPKVKSPKRPKSFTLKLTKEQSAAFMAAAQKSPQEANKWIEDTAKVRGIIE